DWYEAELEGRPLDLAMLTEIATQDDASWQGTDDEVNARIARIRERHDLLAEVRALKAERDAWRNKASLAQRSHNMPPELVDAPDEVAREIVVVWDWVDKAEAELEKSEPDSGRLMAIGQAIKSALIAIAKYCGKTLDIFVSSTTKSAGLVAGPAIIGFVAWHGERLLQLAEGLIRAGSW
ncbi:MAG: hypothetical protein V2I65_19265, partial [Paracoccaceae bacterium]|nr:hypothetical protein [Paracoccaceae bacterium]